MLRSRQIVAPSNKAFENIPYTALNEVWDPEDESKTVPLLQYHILQGTVNTAALEIGPSVVRPTLLTSAQHTNVSSGQNVLVSKQSADTIIFTTSMGTRCTLVEADIAFQGGLVQVVDNLLIPPARLDETSEAFQIPDFLGALYAASLMPEVAERRNVTVFAPQNEAIEAVGGFLEDLDAEELARVMKYHVVPGRVMASSDLSNGSRLETLARDTAAGGDAESLPAESLLVRVAGNNKYINSAQILQPDILIANGILHLVSNVLNPDADGVAPNPDLASQAPVFPVTTAQDPFTSALPCTVDCPITTSASPTADDDSAATTTALIMGDTEDAAPRCTARAARVAALGLVAVGAGLAAWL